MGMTLWYHTLDDATDLRLVLKPSGPILLRVGREDQLCEVELSPSEARSLSAALTSMIEAQTSVRQPSEMEATYAPV